MMLLLDKHDAAEEVWIFVFYRATIEREGRPDVIQKLFGLLGRPGVRSLIPRNEKMEVFVEDVLAIIFFADDLELTHVLTSEPLFPLTMLSARLDLPKSAATFRGMSNSLRRAA